MSFRAVYDEHFRFVWRALRRLGVRDGDVADAAQDVFVVVHRKLPEYEGRGKMTTWLYGICLRVASDRRKAAFERRRSVDDGATISERPDSSADVAATVERRRALALLDELLDELPLEQRAVFTLFELDRHTSEEIAELCGIPLGTVYSRLRSARKTFESAAARRRAREGFRAEGGTR